MRPDHARTDMRERWEIAGRETDRSLRRAMLAMIDKGKPQEAHPAYWAPFVVVGEGAAAK
jgi:CHAT domain-containing protein